ncbi:MAG: class I SAM-dependent methyltransferase [Lachnospiraceae bacterium]|nr:class I SAM-dependent methyltransferase [Lachnospiraceae bacterium]
MSYNEFSKVYDEFMENVPYEEWRDRILQELKEAGIEDGIAADLGCGTGIMTMLLKDAGFDMIGIDSSEEMLGEAMEKDPEREVLWLRQDITEMDLYGTVKAFVSVCDSMNYITDDAGMLKTLRLANNFLDPGGLFIFDICTPQYYGNIGDSVIAENGESGSFIWENSYDAETGINTYYLTLFIKEPDGRYGKSCEEHIQRAYTEEHIKRLIEEAGMEYIASYDDYSFDPAKEDSERVLIVAKEKGK